MPQSQLESFAACVRELSFKWETCDWGPIPILPLPKKKYFYILCGAISLLEEEEKNRNDI